MSLDFTAVDFETANGFRGSPCSIGLVRVRDGVEVEAYYATMRPPEGFDRFDPSNVAVHGLSAEQVADRPRFAELFAEISAFVGEDVLVAHNAAFDVEVFRSALEVSGMSSPGLRAWCTVQLSREVLTLDSHALPSAAAAAGHELRHHHHALDDARACAAVAVHIAARRATDDLDGLGAALGLQTHDLPRWRGRPVRESRATRQVRTMGPIFDARRITVDDEELPDLMRWQDEGRNLPPAVGADPAHPLYGQHLVFTGGLGVARGEAKRLAAAHGARTSSRVTAGTTMLVVGDGATGEELAAVSAGVDAAEGVSGGASEAAVLLDGPLASNKARDALRRLAGGQPLRLLSEPELAELLGEAWPIVRDVADCPVGELSRPTETAD